MGKTTAIEWATATFNPWWGCEKVSPACKHCYAEALSTRYGHAVWGSDAPRRFFSEQHWDQPLSWNREAAKTKQPWRVFCGSMCDVLEDREDLLVQRVRLWELIERTPNLTWLLLTKRPERFEVATPSRWWGPGGWPQNAWAGTTVENQEWADKRIPELLRVPARVRFLSCEPMLTAMNLEDYLWSLCRASAEEHERDHEGGLWCDERGIDWVIAGGESGHHARPTDPRWVRDLRDQCRTADVCFFFKQGSAANWPKAYESCPPDLQIREVPDAER